ncbi:MAG: hypothetical protein ACYCZF_04750 [Anaerolineae bacterium]
MIHRKTTMTLSEIYQKVFSSTHRLNQRTGETRYETRLEIDDLYDFLYAHEYPTWFLLLVKNILSYHNQRAIKEFVMRIHTGESLSVILEKWTHDQIEKEGQRLLKRLCEDIIIWYELPNIEQYKKDNVAKLVPALVAELELDGFIYTNGKLYYSEANVLDEGEEEGILDGLILETGLDNKDVMDHCLELSATDYLDHKWENSIGNSRKYFELVVYEIADRYEFRKSGKHLDAPKYEHAVEIRKYLENNGFLEQKEVNAVQYVYGLLSHTGGHPYIAEKDQARLARNLALSLAQFVLLKFRGLLDTKIAS